MSVRPIFHTESFRRHRHRQASCWSFDSPVMVWKPTQQGVWSVYWVLRRESGIDLFDIIPLAAAAA